MSEVYHRTRRADKADQRDFLFADLHGVASTALCKSKVDLRHLVASPVLDQGLLNSCSACALACAVELALRAGNRPFPHHALNSVCASTMFIYFNERTFEQKAGSNSTVYIRDGLKTLAKCGVCAEELWPYPTMSFPPYLQKAMKIDDAPSLQTAIARALRRNQGLIDRILAQTPTEEALAQARLFQMHKYYSLSTDGGLDELKLALSEGLPFVFGINEPLSFIRTPPSGEMMLPAPDEERLGGHALIALGYDDHKKCFIVRNSYGRFFGDRGYCYMPYDFVTGTFRQGDDDVANTFSFWCLA